MSYTRAKFDNCAVNKELHQSTGLYNYNTDSNKFENSGKCRNELGLLGGPTLSLSLSDIVENSNRLLGLDRALSKCPEQKFIGSMCGTSMSSELLCAPRNNKNSLKTYGGYNMNLLHSCNIVHPPNKF